MDYVGQEAKKLEKLADSFLSGSNEKGAFDAWQKEMSEVLKHGLGTVGAVVEQVQKDNAGMNPSLPHVELIEDGNPVKSNSNGVINELTLKLSPSYASQAVGSNHRSIETVVGYIGVHTEATTEQNSLLEKSTVNQKEQSP